MIVAEKVGEEMVVAKILGVKIILTKMVGKGWLWLRKTG